MIVAHCPFGPGLIAVISGDLSRYVEFENARDHVLVPQGSSWARANGGGYAFNRNAVIRENLQPRHEWVWFLDDDNAFDPEILMRLLSRRVDMVQPLIITKRPPFKPFIYRYDETTLEFSTPDWIDVPTHGISQWDAIACGGLLIQRRVLDAMEYPWFEEGQTSPTGIGEDLHFSRKAIGLGFTCYVDSDNRMDHLLPAGRRAEINAETGQWEISMDVGRGVRVGFDTSVGQELVLHSLDQRG